MLTAIIDGGAKVVGFDIVFPTSIEQSEVPFGDETLGARVRGFDRDYLRALALGARDGKVVLGQVQHQDHPMLPSPGQRAAVGFGRNIRALNVYNDPDDVVRRMPLTFAVDGEHVPSMAAELAARATGERSHAGVSSAGLRRRIAEHAHAQFRGGADDIPTYSLADLRACAREGRRRFFRRHFGGKVVLIGTVLDVEDRKITSKRFATAPEGARAARCALPMPAAGAEIRPRHDRRRLCPCDRGEQPDPRRWPVVEFGRLGVGVFSFALAAGGRRGRAGVRARDRPACHHRRAGAAWARGRHGGVPARAGAAAGRAAVRRA